MGAQKLGLSCDECVVFEDADAGIVAAHAAGMKAVGIGTAANLPDADYLIADLSEMNLDLLKQIYGKG
ncbi:MAG: HAD-IA family hydrolase [Kiritimatiellaceae bacterium]|nr:HAD-IA family hydrolase [Kiritimatiellaceae bacterium]